MGLPPNPSNPSGLGGSTLKIHEYQAKEILAKYGVAVPKGEMANTLEEANDVARKLFAEGASGVVVKAQIHAGGRGKGGGVKVARRAKKPNSMPRTFWACSW